jgi:23S rRNA pseudouridine2605 synthase
VQSPTPKNTWLKLVVSEGRPHLIKRLCAAIGHPVVRLFRPQYAGISVEGMAPGTYRPLSPEEIAALKRAAEGEGERPSSADLRLPARRHRARPQGTTGEAVRPGGEARSPGGRRRAGASEAPSRWSASTRRLPPRGFSSPRGKPRPGRGMGDDGRVTPAREAAPSPEGKRGSGGRFRSPGGRTEQQGRFGEKRTRFGGAASEEGKRGSGGRFRSPGGRTEPQGRFGEKRTRFGGAASEEGKGGSGGRFQSPGGRMEPQGRFGEKRTRFGGAASERRGGAGRGSSGPRRGPESFQSSAGRRPRGGPGKGRPRS